jgi:hypothetical protein
MAAVLRSPLILLRPQGGEARMNIAKIGTLMPNASVRKGA